MKTGLIVKVLSRVDVQEFENIFDELELSYEYNREFNEFDFDEENIESLESIIEKRMRTTSLSYSFSSY